MDVKAKGYFAQAFVREELEVKLPSRKTAVVTEMTGEDAQLMVKQIVRGSPTEGVNDIFERTVKSIDGAKPKGEDLTNLLSGDRLALLFGVRIVNHGDFVPYTLECPRCEKNSSHEVNVKDILTKMKPYPNGDKRDFSVKIDGHDLWFSLPDGNVEKSISGNKEPDLNKKIAAMRLWEDVPGTGRFPVSVKVLKARHIESIRKALKSLECEIDSVITFVCPECGMRSKADITVDPNFLFPHTT